MKISIEIDDELLQRASSLGGETGQSLQTAMEDGLRAVLLAKDRRTHYKLPDLSVGRERSLDPLEKFSWQQLRDKIYGKDDAVGDPPGGQAGRGRTS